MVHSLHHGVTDVDVASSPSQLHPGPHIPGRSQFQGTSSPTSRVSRLPFSPAPKSLTGYLSVHPFTAQTRRLTSASLHLQVCSLFTATLCPTLTSSRRKLGPVATGASEGFRHSQESQTLAVPTGGAGSLPPLLHFILIKADLSRGQQLSASLWGRRPLK